MTKDSRVSLETLKYLKDSLVKPCSHVYHQNCLWLESRKVIEWVSSQQQTCWTTLLRTTRTANDAAATMVANKQLWQPQMCTLEEITTTPFSIMSYKHKPPLPPPVNFLKISDKSYFDGKTKTKHTDAKFGCFWPKCNHDFALLHQMLRKWQSRPILFD